MRTFRTGEEERILFTYDPVPKGSGLPQPGPVFIDRDACPPFAAAGVPPDLRDPAIELVQLRNAEAGCFVARVVRA